MGALLSAWTLLVFVVFIGIVIWVFMHKKEDFDEAAQIPFNEEEQPVIESKDKEKEHG